MANALYDKARQRFLEGDIAWLTDTIKALLVDVDQYGLAISAATNANPIEITTSSTHGLSTGDRIGILGVGGNANANGIWIVTVVNTTKFTLNGSSGSGAYTSGGYVVKLSRDEFLSDVPSLARVATSPALTSKTSTFGVADADDATFTGVTGANCEAVVLYKDTGTASTSPLIAFMSDMTNLPITPNTGTIVAQWNNGPEKIFKL